MQTSPPVWGQRGAPSVEQQVMIDDVMASGQGPKGRGNYSEEGDAFAVSFFFFFFKHTEVIPAVMWMDSKSSAQMINVKRVFEERASVMFTQPLKNGLVSSSAKAGKA